MNILKSIFSVVLGVSIFFSSSYLHASGAHVHGVSDVMMAIEKPYIDIQLKSPAHDLLGFEHQAHTKKEIDAVNRAKYLLAQHDSIFSFAGSGCRFVHSSTNLSDLIKEDEHKHDHEKEEHHKHDHEKEEHHKHDHEKEDGHKHDHEKEDGHKHDHEKEDHHKHDHHKHDHEKEDGHEHDHEKHESHNDVIANYRFQCSNVEKLSEMTFSIFDVFPSINEVQFIWISDKGQNMKKLTPKNNKVKLR